MQLLVFAAPTISSVIVDPNYNLIAGLYMGKKLVSLLRNLKIVSMSIATVVEEQPNVPSYQNNLVTKRRAYISVLVPLCLSGNRHGASWVVSPTRPTRLLRGELTCRCRPWLRMAKARASQASYCFTLITLFNTSIRGIALSINISAQRAHTTPG